MKKTKKEYEEYLNELSPDFESDEWIIGGVYRRSLAVLKKWGTVLRRYDPIGFEAGYQEWKR